MVRMLAFKTVQNSNVRRIIDQIAFPKCKGSLIHLSFSGWLVLLIIVGPTVHSSLFTVSCLFSF